MFAELSSKWLCCNPLEKPTAAASPFAQSQPATSKPQPTSTSPFATTSSPFTTEAAKPSLKSADAAGSSKDYHKLLTEFYQKHNAQKVPEVSKNLEKYKVRKHVCSV